MTAMAAVLVVVNIHAGECLYDAAAWEQLRGSKRRALLEAPRLEQLESGCAVAALARVAADTDDGGGASRVLPLLARFAASNRPVSDELIRAGMRYGEPGADTATWRALCEQWQAQNGRVREWVAARMGAGEFGHADSLYRAFDIAGLLSPAEYLHWATVAETMRSYDGLGWVLCRLQHADARLSILAQSRLRRVLDDMDSTDARAMLERFQACAFAEVEVDTAQLRDWLAESYAQAGLYDRELDVLEAYDAQHRPALHALVRSARRHFALKRFAYAARAASLSWERTRNRDIRALCATIAYESWQRIGRADSAEVWLRRTDLASVGAARRAVVFYQTQPSFDQADSLIRTMPEGPSRDTLWVRQLLFNGRLDSARAYAAGMSEWRWWRNLPAYAFLWRLRTVLYAGDIAAYRSIGDSVQLDPTWEYTAEVLRYRYWHERLQSDGAAAGMWGAFAREIYLRRPTRAESLLVSASLSPHSRGLFVVQLVKAFLAVEDLDGATRVAGEVDPVAALPEHTYYCAEVLLARGRTDAARRLLEQLILHHPDDIFSSKARLLLLKAQS